MRDNATAIEREAAKLYDKCHPDDSFHDLKRRAAFSKEDRLLLRDWLATAARLARPDVSRPPSGSATS